MKAALNILKRFLALLSFKHLFGRVVWNHFFFSPFSFRQSLLFAFKMDPRQISLKERIQILGFILDQICWQKGFFFVFSHKTV